MWGRLLEILVSEPDFEWLMVDTSHIKVHSHAAGARGGNQDMGRTKGAQLQDNPAVDAHGLPVRMLLQQVLLQIVRWLVGFSRE